MKALKRFASVMTTLLLLGTSGGGVFAWNQVAHEFINIRISTDGSPLFVWAGTYPDMAFGDPELANAFHAPTPAVDDPETKLNPTVPWRESANFAALWLDSVDKAGFDERTPDVLAGRPSTHASAGRVRAAVLARYAG